ncbi:MAG: galactonate dehydratase, partial [Zetaproteobacteria bacterium]
MTFRGYRRRDGKVGIRNHVLILPTSICAARVASDIARGVRGCVAACPAYGCCQVGSDARLTFRTLLNTAANPNVGAIVVVGLGCEGLEPLAMLQAGENLGKPARGLVIQEEGGSPKATDSGAVMAKRMAGELAAHPREEVPASSLVLGLECGGSDATSGLAANPALGVASDLTIGGGGTCILSETTESIGAEHVLARRGVSEDVSRRLLDIVAACER